MANDWTGFEKVETVFYAVRTFVGKKFPKLLHIHLDMLCGEILKYRNAHHGKLEGRRAFMHVGHLRRAVCTWAPAIGNMGLQYLVGLYLHEFGHLGSQGGEEAADGWVKEHFGITIHYRSKLQLEWVSLKDARKALAAIRRR